jgi:endonuclease G
MTSEVSMKRALSVAVVAALSLAGAGCAPKATAVKFTAHQFIAPQAISVADQARLDGNCPFGAPKPLPEWPVGKTEMVFRDGYVLEHSSEWKVPYWVCESLEQDELHGAAPRRNVFKPDDRLTPGLRAELADYKGSGFDRGHQAPAGDQTKDQRLKDETFFLSNMVPQNGNQNQQIWATLEDLVRGWAEDAVATDVRVITGPVFHTDEDLKNGFSLVDTIGKNSVGVPKAIYKIVSGSIGGERRAVAFLIENRPHSKPFDYRSFVVKVQTIEERTGFNFMPGLDPGDRVKLETQKGNLFR